MFTRIKVLNLANSTIHGRDGKDFEVTYINTYDGRSFSAYKNTPGLELLKEGETYTLFYRLNERNGKTYNNVMGVSLPDKESLAGEIRDALCNIQELLEKVLKSMTNQIGQTCQTTQPQSTLTYQTNQSCQTTPTPTPLTNQTNQTYQTTPSPTPLTNQSKEEDFTINDEEFPF